MMPACALACAAGHLAPGQLAELLKAVAVYATGGLTALAGRKDAGATRWIAGEAAVGHSMTARGDGKDPSPPMPGQSRWHHLYNTRRWQRIARAQLAAEPLCAFCAARGLVVPATVVDHVEPHHGDRNKFWFGKLQSLCATCHGRDKRSEERKGFRPDIGPDGWPTDPRHPANRR